MTRRLEPHPVDAVTWGAIPADAQEEWWLLHIPVGGIECHLVAEQRSAAVRSTLVGSSQVRIFECGLA
jgi:hypothetical protein